MYVYKLTSYILFSITIFCQVLTNLVSYINWRLIFIHSIYLKFKCCFIYILTSLVQRIRAVVSFIAKNNNNNSFCSNQFWKNCIQIHMWLWYQWCWLGNAKKDWPTAMCVTHLLKLMVLAPVNSQVGVKLVSKRKRVISYLMVIFTINKIIPSCWKCNFCKGDFKP